MAIVVWPQSLLRAVRATYFLRYRTRSAGVSLTGQVQTVATGIAYWAVRLELPTQLDGALMKEFDAFVSLMQGRSNIAQFQVCDPYRYGPKVSPKQQPFSDGQWFTDGTGFVVAGTEPMVTTQAAVKGDASLTVSLVTPSRPPFRMGDEFSYDYFLYRVTAADAAGNVQFSPRLRTDIPSGAVLETDPPSVRMRFADDDEGQRSRDYLRYGEPIALNFVEAFDR